MRHPPILSRIVPIPKARLGSRGLPERLGDAHRNTACASSQLLSEPSRSVEWTSGFSGNPTTIPSHHSHPPSPAIVYHFCVVNSRGPGAPRAFSKKRFLSAYHTSTVEVCRPCRGWLLTRAWARGHRLKNGREEERTHGTRTCRGYHSRSCRRVPRLKTTPIQPPRDTTPERS